MSEGVRVGSIYAELKLEKKAFEKGLHESGGMLGGLAKVALGAGVAIGGALIGVGVAATKSAADFQDAMELIVTQAGASSEEVEGLKKSVLGLAGEVGTAPDELAKGLYHLESAGFHGAAAMDVLKIAAEGAKVGHADLESVTNALVASLKSGVGGITDAGQAMGVLNAIVGAGNMRMEDLTAAIGTGVLSAAKNFGVSIQSVGGALAAMTDQGIPAVDAANAIRSAMRLMAAPTSAAVKSLKSIGLSSTSLAKDLRSPGGIQTAMIDLKKHMTAAGLNATEQAQLLTKAFGGKQSQGILTLVGNLKVLDEKQKLVTSGTGAFGAAWEKTQQDVAVKADKAKASFEALSISLGDKLLPVAGAVFDGLASAINSPALQGGIDALGSGMASIAEGAVKGFGFLTGTVLPAFSSAFGTITSAILPPVQAAFDTFSTTILPALQREFGSIVDNLLPALGAAFSVIVTDVVPIVSQAFATFADEIFPRVAAAMDFVATTVIPSISEAITWLAENVLPPLMSAFSAIAENVIPILAAAFDTVVNVIRDNWPTISSIAETVGNAVKTAVEGISAVIKVVAPVIRWLAETIFPILGAAAGILLHVIDGAFKAIGVVWNAAWDIAKGIAKGIGDAFSALVGVFNTVGSAITGVFKGAMNFLIGIVNGIIGAVDSIQVHIGRIGLDTPAGFIGVGPFDWNGLQIPHLPYLSQGGIVTAPTLAMIGEGNKREAVIPLDDPRVASLLGGSARNGDGARYYQLTVQGDLRAPTEASVLTTLQRMAEVGG